MLKTFKYALLAGVLMALTPQAMAETPADTLVIAKQIDDLISMDPAEAYELSGIEILANTYDRIMRFEPTDITKLVGGVAESVTVSEDGKTFTFKIRPGQKFASGNPVTAMDAACAVAPMGAIIRPTRCSRLPGARVRPTAVACRPAAARCQPRSAGRAHRDRASSTGMT